MLFFDLSSTALGILLFVVLLGATGLGILIGHRVREHADELKEPIGIIQAALLGFVGLLLAFGLSRAVSRYEDRRSNVVTVANAIGTAYLRAQTLHEPVRSRSLDLLVDFNRTAVSVSDHVPGSAGAKAAVATEDGLERQLWRLAGSALDTSPVASAPRLYVESLNEMFDSENARVVALGNRIPTAVLILDLVGSALALGLLAAYLKVTGRGEATVVLASALVAFLLLVTTDLDRPTRGLIRVPDTALTHQLASMEQPPAAPAPRRGP
jgi:hypothetical protein